MPEIPPPYKRAQEDQLEELTHAMEEVARILPGLKRGAEDQWGNDHKRREADAFTFSKFVVPALLALIIGFSGWMFGKTQDHGERITIIENTRIPAQTRDALQAGITTLTTQMTEVQRRLQTLETELSSLRNALSQKGVN